VSWSIRLNEEVECLKKMLQSSGSAVHSQLQKSLELVTAKKRPQSADPIVHLKWVVTGIRFMGIKLKNSITLAQSFCARFGTSYTSVLLSLCNPHNWSSHKISPLNPVHTFTSYLSEIYFNNTFSSVPNYADSFFPERATR